MSIVFLVAGFVLLLIGGELLVRGAASLAHRLGMSPLLIGLTVVAFGTSAPELVVSVDAALDGSPGIAIGNVVGSNISNILLILGLGAVIRPVPAQAASLLRDGGMVLLASVVVAAVGWSGVFRWWQGGLMVAALTLYLIVSYRHDMRDAALRALPDVTAPPAQSLLRALQFIVLGLVGLVLGAEWLVDGAVDIARSLGVSDEIIGVTLVAVGTSLPELAIVVVAARKGHTDMVFGNVVGSNIFNCLGILGVTALVAQIPVDLAAIGFDLLVMVGVTLLLLPLAASGRRMSRPEGVVLLTLFVAFVAINFLGKPVLDGS
ncbi:MAG: calcium/sodium antiporter [Alphaproteobacteria bacterium]